MRRLKDGHTIYTRLFAQPIKMEPRLSQDALAEGIYKESDKFEKKLSFTDIGETIWNVVKKMYKDVYIRATYLSEVEFKWDVMIYTNDFKITLRCARVDRTLWKVPRDAFVVIELKGDEEAIVEFVQKFIKALGRPPYNINDWKKFKEFTGISKREVIQEWELLTSRRSAGRR